MPSFNPIDLTSPPQHPLFTSSPPLPWLPVLSHSCSFSASHFDEVMLNLIRNPNLTASHLFRADILYDSHGPAVDVAPGGKTELAPWEMEVQGFKRYRTLIRTFVPRNPQLDAPLTQTCHLYTKEGQQRPDEAVQLVIYLPHVTAPDEIPYYHPSVRALAFLFQPSQASPHPSPYSVSIHILPFSASPLPLPARLGRTVHHLLLTVHKHASGLSTGYTKRTQHDVIVSQPRFQTTYARLKSTHAARLLANWVEATDPTKHVFEDLGIAAFLIEVWRDMYDPAAGQPAFPGFADLGCGNGLLVDILLREGYHGVGLDVRARKSWATFPTSTQQHLRAQILVPSPLVTLEVENQLVCMRKGEAYPPFHNGLFKRGTFLVSNHADELTAWTPLLAALSRSAFLAIPCCSHSLSGARFRAPPRPADARPSGEVKGRQKSAYAALVAYVAWLAAEVGFESVEREELRIGSTRNVGVLARWHGVDVDVDADTESKVEAVLSREGGGEGWLQRAMSLRLKQGSGH